MKLARRQGNAIDDVPVDMRRAEAVGAALPRAAARGVDERRGITIEPGTRITGRDDRKALGVFAFRVTVVVVAIEAEQRGDVRVGPSRQQRQAPAEQRRREPQRADRVTDVVLTVPKRALAVLPGLAPEDRGQADEKSVLIK